GLFQRLPLSRDIEQPLTFESSGEVTPASLHCYLPLEGVSSQVSGSTSCDLKRNSPHLPTSSNFVGSNNDTSTQTVCNDSLNMAFVQNENLSHEWSTMSGAILSVNESPWEKKSYWIFSCSECRNTSSGAGDETCIVNANVNAKSESFLLTTASGAAFRPIGSVHVGFPASRPSKRSHSDVLQGTLPSKGSPLKRSHSSTSIVKRRRTMRFRRDIARHDTSGHVRGVSYVYDDLGDCDQWCYHCGATFWFGERLKGHSNSRRPVYHLCCGEGRIYMEPTPDPPEYIKNLLQNKHFMENIRAYNQMFAMTSLGAKIDKSINNGRGPYVFKVSGRQELENRMRHFGGLDNSDLDPEIVQEFKIRLYNGDGTRGYELPTSNTLGQ
ncbi:hypothetical protein Tco_1470586, partial [Tanacetum coccineum]